MKKVNLKISGMTCSACQTSLEKKLNKENGIYNATVNLVMSNAIIEYDESILDIEKIEEIINSTGYKSQGIYKMKEEKKKGKISLIIMLILTVMVMFISMIHMTPLPLIPYINPVEYPTNYSVILMVLTIPILLLSIDLIIRGIKNLFKIKPNMDSLVTIGVLSAFIYSIYSTIMVLNGDYSYVNHIYYESAAVVIFFIKLGKYIDKENKEKTKESIKKLIELTPNEATVIIDDEEKVVNVTDIKVGDILIAKPGERIAVDGIVINGYSTVNESFITGEGIPVDKEKDSSLIAGSINYDGYLQYKAEKVGEDTTVSQIIKIVIESAASKAPISRLVDKVSAVFIPIILLLAIISFSYWIYVGESFDFALNIFVSLLVISCPCALGLATPLAMMISTGLLATRSVLVKNSASLEKASKVKTVIFDKTGTLTKGKLGVSEIINFSDYTDDQLLGIIGSIESKSEHPISKAIVSYCSSQKIKLYDVTDFKVIPGYGLIAKYNNLDVIVGNKNLMHENNIDISVAEVSFNHLTKNGSSILYTAINDRLVALIGVIDTIKDSAYEVVSKLNDEKINVVMLTGDNEKTAKYLAERIGINKFYANLLPQNKKEIVDTLKEKGPVIFVGDGINDSPSLVSADIGIAIGNGTDIAIESADAILLGDDLNRLYDFIYVSERTITNIKQNLFWAFFYNILMIPIAMGILIDYNIILNPMIAGIAMTISSITVVFNALRLKRINFKRKKRSKKNEEK
ncbi:MAG TPA: copper-translocating P-type ATPase [Tenericutes bacterium]|nr:copper-translocating P-type ATPase [Mycoplasmatota bacterium]